MNKTVYYFGDNLTEGNAEMRNLLGGKGANLAEMCKIGLPVPHGFTISTEVCSYYFENDRNFPETLEKKLISILKKSKTLLKCNLAVILVHCYCL